MLTDEEIEKRKSLWLALSDLWLDTEMTEKDCRYIVKEMINSGYPLEKIEKILAEEVAPVVYSNLLNVFPGGNWEGFEEEWLHSAIIKNLEAAEKNFIRQIWLKNNVNKFLMTELVRENWMKIVEIYQVIKI